MSVSTRTACDLSVFPNSWGRRLETMSFLPPSLTMGRTWEGGTTRQIAGSLMGDGWDLTMDRCHTSPSTGCCTTRPTCLCTGGGKVLLPRIIRSEEFSVFSPSDDEWWRRRMSFGLKDVVSASQSDGIFLRWGCQFELGVPWELSKKYRQSSSSYHPHLWLWLVCK